MKTTPTPTILEAMDDPEIWARWFRDPAEWAPWRVFLAALFGLPLSEDDLAFYRQCTGRSAPPTGTTEAWLVVGRRGGKSFILALIAVYLAIFKDWSAFLIPGERGYIKVLAVDRRQARVIYSYARALIAEVPALAVLLASDSGDELALTTGLTIEVQTASFRSVRGYTIVAALLDEIAFWRSDESAGNPDFEILRALRPAMATVPGAMLLAGSSPYARRGELWSAHRRYWGKSNAAPLVWQAATRVMHPSLPQAFIDAEYERDPEGAEAEYGAQFRSDLADFVQREMVEAAVIRGLSEITPRRGVKYFAFTDPSGGSADSFTLAIGHGDGDRLVLDCLREVRPPFSPENVVIDFATLLKQYGIVSVCGDRYGGEWPREQFRNNGIEYIVSERTKSEIYLEFLPLLNSGRIQLLDNLRLINQLCGLERKTSRVGKDSVDHQPGGHDDLCNAGCGVLVNIVALSSPALWKRESLLDGDGPLPMPAVCNYVFGSLAATPDGSVAACCWATLLDMRRPNRGGGDGMVPRLALLDIEAATLADLPKWLPRVARRLSELQAQCGQRQHDGRGGPVGAPMLALPELAQRIVDHGLRGAAIEADWLALQPDERALRAAFHVSGGAVRLAPPAYEKSLSHPFAALSVWRVGAAPDAVAESFVLGVLAAGAAPR